MEILVTIAEYFLWFILYSVCGWIMETLLYAVRKKQAVKRGFLFGPLCPIYGVGVLLCMFLFYGKIENIFVLFFVGMLVCTVLEYVTHFVLEKLFHATWWDYSTKKFNIKGRICLQNSLFFGAGVVLIVKGLQPFVISLTHRIPQQVLLGLFFVLYTVFVVDLTTTIASLKNTVQMLKEMQSAITEYMQKEIDETDAHMNEIAERIKGSTPLTHLVERLRKKSSPLVKLRNTFPNFSMEHYKEALQLLFEKLDEHKK